jgi:hypothetical protein
MGDDDDVSGGSEQSAWPAASIVALAGGLGAWIVVGAGVDGRLGVFAAIVVAMAALLGALLGRAGVPPSLALVVGPISVAHWSTGRGDGDGLWMLVFPVLVVVGILAVGAALATAELGGRVPALAGLRTACVGVLGRAVLPAVALGALATIALLLWLPSRLSDPWPPLEAAIEDYRPPAAFTAVEANREGDRLCSESCGPTVELVMTSPLGLHESCAAFESSLADWVEISSLDWQPAGDPGVVCRGNGTVTSGGESLGVQGYVRQASPGGMHQPPRPDDRLWVVTAFRSQPAP